MPGTSRPRTSARVQLGQHGRRVVFHRGASADALAAIELMECRQHTRSLVAGEGVEDCLRHPAGLHQLVAAQARQVLNKALSLCDFTTRVAMPRTRAKKSVHQLLDTDLALGD